ncbi:trp operon leader peptide [Streptomyces sp. NPDC002932]|uniref:trp operon leader peptide n=1 Tax=Streptomyces sp. NPDC002932 TaxID=3364672 RepID=UPI00367DEA20
MLWYFKGTGRQIYNSLFRASQFRDRPEARSPHRVERASSRPIVGYGSAMFAHSTRNWWWTAHPAAH